MHCSIIREGETKKFAAGYFIMVPAVGHKVAVRQQDTIKRYRVIDVIHQPETVTMKAEVHLIVDEGVQN